MYFSIIVPIYGIEKYIKYCIDSLLSQTYENFEIILVDDGSKDRCPQICDEYAKKDLRVKVIHKENGGLVSARKAGLAVAEGDYIISVDGDDWISPETLSIIAKAIDDMVGLPDVVCFDYYEATEVENIEHHQICLNGLYKDDDLLKLQETMLYDVKKKNHFNIWPNLCFKAVKRSVLYDFQNNVPNEISFGEDVAVVYPLLSEVNSILVIDNCLYYYRTNLTSMVNAYDINLYQKTKRLYQYLECALSEQQREIQLPYYACIMITNLLVNDMRIKTTLGEMHQLIKKYCEDEDLLYYIKKVKLKNLPLKHMLIHLLLKTKQFFILSLILKLYRKIQVK